MCFPPPQIVGVGWLILYGLANASSSSLASVQTDDSKLSSFDIEQADSNHTRVKKSEWDRMVKDAIKAKCPVMGMSKDEVTKALGAPASMTDVGWTYKGTVTHPCTRYAGETCADQNVEQVTDILRFTPNGYLAMPIDTKFITEGC
jgi:hypothetical protein